MVQGSASLLFGLFAVRFNLSSCVGKNRSTKTNAVSGMWNLRTRRGGGRRLRYCRIICPAWVVGWSLLETLASKGTDPTRWYKCMFVLISPFDLPQQSTPYSLRMAMFCRARAHSKLGQCDTRWCDQHMIVWWRNENTLRKVSVTVW
jgi:hypothetical protein